MQYIKIMINIIIKLIWVYNIVQELIYTRAVALCNNIRITQFWLK